MSSAQEVTAQQIHIYRKKERLKQILNLKGALRYL